jgi:hypothetical protein
VKIDRHTETQWDEREGGYDNGECDKFAITLGCESGFNRNMQWKETPSSTKGPQQVCGNDDSPGLELNSFFVSCCCYQTDTNVCVTQLSTRVRRLLQ